MSTCDSCDELLLIEEFDDQSQGVLPSVSNAVNQAGDIFTDLKCDRPYKYDSSQTEYFVETESKVTLRKKDLEAHRHLQAQAAESGGQDCLTLIRP